jgi:ParB/RepB/Spo0J family partition protein
LQLAVSDESTNYIVYAETVNIQIDRIKRHPANRPLGLDRDKIDQLKALISQYGYQSSQPLVVRTLGDKYQIIKGEHRYIACVELGFTEIPCVVQEMDDTEALIQLIVGNVQTENKPLEIGLNALDACSKASKKGLSVKNYAERIGILDETVRNYVNAADVHRFVLEQNQHVLVLLEHRKLSEIYKCGQPDWVWLHSFVAENELSTSDTLTVCKGIRDLSGTIKLDIIPELLDIDAIKKTVVKEALTGKTKALGTAKGVIAEIQDCYEKLDSTIFYTFDIEKGEIIERETDLRDIFVLSLKSRDNLDKAAVSSTMKSVLDKKQQHTKESAEATAEYYRSENNEKELAEQRRIGEQQAEYAFNAWLACESIDDIAVHLTISAESVERMIDNQKSMLGQDEPPESLQVFNLWNFHAPDPRFGIDYPGRIPGQIVENVLHYYTKPFDLVVDPMGGGSTIDVCKAMHRRYLSYDIQPARDDIHKRDINDGFPDECKGCDLIFMDPPYWNQKKGEYSVHETNRANMDITGFYSAMEGIFKNASHTLRPGGYIAVIIGPTQENGIIYDHAIHLYKLLEKRFTFVNRVIVPYTTQQAQVYHIAEAKEGRYMLKLYRDMVVFRL